VNIVAGNWKMHMGPSEAVRFADAFVGPLEDLRGAEGSPSVLLFPPALSFSVLRDHAVAASIGLGVQNLHAEASGAFTGELSAEMARDAGATWALVGHSERRHIFGETDDEVAAKVQACLRAGLRPMICVGETLDERRAGRLEEVLARQLDAVLDVFDGDTEWALAYEPVWAIGTGETATPQDAGEAHDFLAARIRTAGQTLPPILYGGSVKPENAAELMTVPSVSGVLVGGASLDAEAFAAIASAGIAG